MSYAISKQNFIEKAGRSTTGLDEQFTVCWANCQQMEEIVDKIRLHMVEYVESMRSLCISGHAVSDGFKSFYERIPVRLTVVAIRYENIQHGFRTDKIQLLERLVNQNVFTKLEEVKLDLAGLRTKVGDRDVSRKRYEHYLEKIQELRENRIKAKNKGKDLSVSDLDKLARNEKKFEDSRMEYVAVNHVVTKQLWQMWSRRYAVLDPIYNEIVKIQANFTQALSNQLQSIVQPLKQQMLLELPEEPVPAIFASNGATNAKQRNGSHVNVEDGAEHDGAAENTPTSTGARTLKQGKQPSPTAPVVAVKNGRGNVQEPDEEDEEEDTDSDEDEETARKKAKAKAKAAKAKAAAAAAAAAAAPIPFATAATLMVAPKTTKPVAPTTAEDEEEDGEDESEEEETEEERKARKAAKKAKKEKKRREKEAAAAAASGKTKKGSSTDASLDFLSAVAAEIPATTKPKKGTAAAAGGGLDLLSFSPMKPVVAAEPAAPATAAAKKKALLDVDSFFAPAQPAASPAAAGAGGIGLAHPLHVAPSLGPQSSDDPFADLPSAQSGPPVDLFAMPVQAIEPPRQQQQHQHQYQQAPLSYSSQFASSPADLSRAASLSTASNQQPGYMRASSLTPGGPNTNGLDDPLFTAPLPLPTSITPTAAAAPAATTAAKKPSTTGSAAAAATAARRKVVQPDSDDSSSESSTDESETDDEVEGSIRKKAAAKKSAAAKVTAAAKPLGVPVKGVPTTGGLSDIHIAPAAVAAPPAAAVASSAASLATPASAAASSGPRTPQPAPPPANGRATATAAAAAALRSPEDYSPTRNTYNPHGDKKPKPEDPFGGVNEDW